MDNNDDIIKQGLEQVMNTYSRFPMVIVEGRGAKVWDANGKEYLDMVGGIAVCILGHANPYLNRVLKEQSEKLWHVSNLYWNKPQIELAGKLVNAANLGKAFFCNSGAEANEAAIKLTRKYFYRQNMNNKTDIIVFKNSFHGRTMATITATGQDKYQQGFAPLLPGFNYAEFNELGSVEALINDKTAAIMVEPVQGEGGVLPSSAAFIEGLRKLCDEKGLLLIFDEVQCGVGRLGECFAFQHYGVNPDIITLAKGLGGGFPIGAMLASNEAAKGFEPGDHASTFGGNPLACALGNAIIETVNNKDFLLQVKKKGDYLKGKLTGIDDARILNCRGMGLMLGLEMSCDNKSLIELCRLKGLLLIGAGPMVVRWVPPLNIETNELDQAIEIFKQALVEWKD